MPERILIGSFNLKVLRLIERARLGPKGHAMLVYYFLSLEKPEFTEYARQLSAKTSKNECYSMAWYFIMDHTDPNDCTIFECNIITFIRDYCERNKWDMSQWLKTQSKA